MSQNSGEHLHAFVALYGVVWPTHSSPERPPTCHIARLPDLLLFDIFEYIQPRNSSVFRIPQEVALAEQRLGFTNLSSTSSEVSSAGSTDPICRPYELHLAQICRQWRRIAFKLRNGACLDVQELADTGYPDLDRKVSRGFPLLLQDHVRCRSVRTLCWNSSPVEGFGLDNKTVALQFINRVDFSILQRLVVATHHLLLLTQGFGMFVSQIENLSLLFIWSSKHANAQPILPFHQLQSQKTHLSDYPT